MLLCDKKCQHAFHIESIVDEIPVVSVMKEYRIIFLLGTKFVGSIIIVVNVFLAPVLNGSCGLGAILTSSTYPSYLEWL